MISICGYIRQRLPVRPDESLLQNKSALASGRSYWQLAGDRERRLRDLTRTRIFFLSHFSRQGRPHGLVLHQEHADELLKPVDLGLPFFDGRLLPAWRGISMIRFGIHKVLPTVLDIIRARNHSVRERREFVVSTSPRCLRVARCENIS